MDRIPPIVHVLGLVVLIFAFALLLPVAAAYYFQDAAILEYDEAFAITFGAGLVMWLGTRHKKRELQIKDGFLLVALVWMTLPAFATIPFLFYFPDLSFTDAYFETVSGMTTTGATVLTGLDSLPPSVNLWRAELVWVGGMGLIVLAYLFLYLISVVTMTLIMTASGLDFITSFSAVLVSINNTGPGLNQVGPATTYASLTDFQTWVCTFAMLLGRLELFTFFVLLTRSFWRS